MHTLRDTVMSYPSRDPGGSLEPPGALCALPLSFGLAPGVTGVSLWVMTVSCPRCLCGLWPSPRSPIQICREPA